MKKVSILSMVLCSCLYCACNDKNGTDAENKLPDLPTRPIIVMYENDVHCTLEGFEGSVSIAYGQPQGRIIFK